MGYRRPNGELPPEDSYSRVTEPERFGVVVEAADLLVQRLSATYDVLAVPAELDRALRAVELTPREGAPITMGVSAFPGVVLKAGVWTPASSFPACGCDACDESGQDAVDSLLEELAAIVHGGFSEHLSARGLESVWDHGDRRRSSTAPLGRSERRALAMLAPAGERRWPAWPLRSASVTPAT